MVTNKILNRYSAVLSIALLIVSIISAPVYATPLRGFKLDDSIRSAPGKKVQIFHTTEIGMGTPAKYVKKSPALEEALYMGTEGQGPAVDAWKQLIATAQNADPLTQLGMVNDFFNQVRYVGEAPGMDKWQMPVEFMANGGDCEDYAIAKFVTLRMLGWHQDRARIVLLTDSTTGQQHAILTVYYANNAYVLDNLNRNILTADQIGHYKPVASLNESRLWVHWNGQQKRNSVAGLPQNYDLNG